MCDFADRILSHFVSVFYIIIEAKYLFRNNKSLRLKICFAIIKARLIKFREQFQCPGVTPFIPNILEKFRIYLIA